MLFRSKPPETVIETPNDYTTHERDLINLLVQKDARIAELNRRLRDIGVTSEHVDKMRIVPVRVVQLGPNRDLDTYIIDAGSSLGVDVGQAVVVGQNLVGVVVKVEEHAAMILSLASRGCYLSARLGEPGEAIERPMLLCAVRGAGNGGVRVVIFSGDTAAKEGWTAITSGLEGMIPAGLIIGTMQGVLGEGEESGTFEAVLRVGSDLASLDYVTVLAKDMPAGSDK